VSRMSMAGMTSVTMSRMSAVAEVRRVADVAAVPTMSGMSEVSQSSDCHRGQPGTAERETEAIKVHTKYYVSDRALVTGRTGGET
jgi:hypothetical protein